jgi:predicted RNase H-like HicB family nuclease
MNFQINIELDETGYYIAEVPALPGCISQGQTLEEAKENIKEAISAWIEVVNERTKIESELSVEVAI